MIEKIIKKGRKTSNAEPIKQNHSTIANSSFCFSEICNGRCTSIKSSLLVKVSTKCDVGRGKISELEKSAQVR